MGELGGGFPFFQMNTIPVHLQIKIKGPVTRSYNLETKHETIGYKESHEIRLGYNIKSTDVDVEIVQDSNKKVTTYIYYKIDAKRSDPDSILFQTITEEVVK